MSQITIGRPRHAVIAPLIFKNLPHTVLFGKENKKAPFPGEKPPETFDEFIKHIPLESQVLQVSRGKKPALALRYWHRKGQKDKVEQAKGPVVLFVPGLGGRTEWATPLVDQVLDEHPLIYGLDTQVLGDDPVKRGHLKSRRDLVDELNAAVEYLSNRHDGDVYLGGISLGALTITHLLADKPKRVKGAILINPAYRPAGSSFDPLFYLRTSTRYLLEQLGLSKPRPLSMPYQDDAEVSEEMAWVKEAKSQVSSLSATSFVELGKMTFLEAFAKAKRVFQPVLMFVAGKDTICDPKAMVHGYNLMPSQQKTMHHVEDAHHNMIFESHMALLAKQMKDWLTELKKDHAPKFGAFLRTEREKRVA